MIRVGQLTLAGESITIVASVKTTSGNCPANKNLGDGPTYLVVFNLLLWGKQSFCVQISPLGKATKFEVFNMSWTDDRVARLAKLWAEGFSASQIATDLGGVTRNAVIGKVHRLGLSGRAKPAGKSNGGPRRKPAGTRATGKNSPRTQRQSSRTNGARSGTNTQTDVVVAYKPKPVEDLVAPKSKELSLLDLTDSTCKWPTGDPTMPGFSFCGHQTNEEKPYCAFHNKLAFQPPSDRRRRR